MKNFLSLAACSILAVIASGCSGYFSPATRTVAVDSEQQHDEVLRLHDLQIFQNLARAYNCQPILISQYSLINQKLLTKLAPSAGYGRSITDTTYLPKTVLTTVGPKSAVPSSVVTTAGTAASAIQSVANPLTYSFTATRQHTVDFTQNPVYDTPDAYDAYKKFMNLRKRGSNLLPVECASTPPKGGVCFPLKGAQKWAGDGRYYWVPTEYQDDFFALTMTLANAISSTTKNSGKTSASKGASGAAATD